MSFNTVTPAGWLPGVPWVRRGASIFTPWGSVTTSAARQAQATFQGALYDVPHPIVVSGFDCTSGAVTVAGTLVVALYQSRTDADNIVQLLSVFSGNIALATTNFNLTGSPCFVDKAKRLHILWGTPTGGANFNMIAHAASNMQVYTSAVQNGKVPGAYTTTQAATLTPPAVLNVASGTGIATASGATAVALISRLT